MKILILNGPNLNLLGLREPDIYGRKTYADLKAYIAAVCRDEDIGFEIRQSNHEGDLVDMIQEAYGIFDALVINPAAYTHTSIAILDALKAVSIPAVEVHLSDISEREQFRHVSYAGLACIKTFKGLGFEGYKEALLFLKEYLSQGSRE
ncbi:MAG: type II 3-dehydroquinate dehydratase [Oscillospiraceae bacterium]|nr:type II 3-dehydroquinate dehydratase [Oscillospiraceae bacterium]